MKTVYLSLICLGFILPAHSQSTTFQKAYGGASSDYFQSVREAPDGGFILAGSTSSYGPIQFSTDQNIYLIKTDSNGTVAWSKTFSYLSYIEEAIRILPGKSDSSYMVLTNFRDTSYNNLFFGSCRLDVAGNEIWNKTYSINGLACFAASILETTGGFLISGAVYKDATNDNDAFLLKIDLAGQPLWCKLFSTQSPYQDKAFNISQSGNGDILLTGVSFYSIIHDYALLVISTDSLGNLKWMKTYANSFNSRAVAGYQLHDGSFLIGGQAVNFGSGANDLLLMKTDTIGTPLWTKVYGDSYIQLAADMILSGEGPILAGTCNTGVLPKAMTLKTDFDGNVLTSRLYGDTLFSESAKQIIPIPGTGFIISGERIGAFDNGYSAEDFYLIKAGADLAGGCQEGIFIPVVDSFAATVNSFTDTDTINVTSQDIQFTVSAGVTDTTFCETFTGVASVPELSADIIFPNPSHGKISIRLGNSSGVKKEIEILNLLGEHVFKNVQTTDDYIEIGTVLPAGIYFARIHTDYRTITQKIIIE